MVVLLIFTFFQKFRQKANCLSPSPFSIKHQALFWPSRSLWSFSVCFQMLLELHGSVQYTMLLAACHGIFIESFSFISVAIDTAHYYTCLH